MNHTEALQILEKQIGHTPTQWFDLPNNNQLFIKREDHNPTGSIKDRTIFSIISRLENLAEINEFVIASSGNAGISTAYIANRLKKKCAIFSWPQIGKGKIKLITELGAELFIRDSAGSYGEGGWIYEAVKYAQNAHCYYIDQFNNPNTSISHEQTTRELFQQCGTIDYIFVGIGSGGTAEGLRKYIRKNQIDTKLVIIDPTGGLFYDTYHNQEAIFKRHRVESLSPSFIPKNLADLKDFDDIIQIDDHLIDHARQMMLADLGFLGGEIGGFTYIGAKHYLRDKNIKNARLAIINSDSFMRYL